MVPVLRRKDGSRSVILGLNGRKGSGKDTVGAYLVERHGFTRVSFADKLKESAAALFGIDVSLFERLKNDPESRVYLMTDEDSDKYSWEPRECHARLSVREFLQRYGTESHRDVFGSDFWIEQALRPLRESGILLDPSSRICITDARFDNELRAIRLHGGTNIRIERLVAADDEHASEAEPRADLIDYMIPNFGTIEDLRLKVDFLMQSAFGI